MAGVQNRTRQYILFYPDKAIIAPEVSMIFHALINNITLLLALCLIFRLVHRHLKPDTLNTQILFGVIFGVASLLGMLNPMQFEPGIIFDGRSVLLSMAGLFGGLIPAVIATIIAGGYRLWLGGAGAWTGVGVIVTSAGLGVMYYAFRRKRPNTLTPLHLYAFGVFVHISMLLWMLTLPWPLAWEVLERISLPVMLIFPVASLIVGVMLADQEAQHRDEEALAESEERFRLIAENIKEVFWIVSPDYQKLEYVSPTYDEIWGYDRENLYQHPRDWLNAVVVEDRNRFIEYLKKIKKALPLKIIFPEFRIVRPDHTQRWISSRGFPVFNTQGELYRVVGISEDITEQKRAEEELEKHRSRLENLVKRRTTELENKNAQLERMNKLFVGREIRIKELRDRVKELEQR